jgi:outer membrane murein-binding lipoprotein Lpp
MRHHSATHLMHKALREVLGHHVQQKGSLVDEDKTRFDFSHNAPMTADEIRRVESIVNAEVLENKDTTARVMPIDEAQKLGAMMLFGEKYGDEVRVLDIGSSRELCGGTHVRRTGDIGLFRIVSEGGVAAGIRRVEAIAGSVALAQVQEESDRLARLASALKAQPAELELKVSQLQESVRALEKEAARSKQKMAASQGDDLASSAVDVKGVKVLAARLEGADAKMLRDTMDQLKGKLKSSAIVLAAPKATTGEPHRRRDRGPHRQGEGGRAGQLRRRPGGRQGRRASPTWRRPAAPTARPCRRRSSRSGAGWRSGFSAESAPRGPPPGLQGEAAMDVGNIGAIVFVVIFVAIFATVVRAVIRDGRRAKESAARNEAMFQSMFPELQPYYHPLKLLDFVRARLSRSAKPGVWKNPPGFATESAETTLGRRQGARAPA